MPKKKRKVHDNPERVMSCGDLSFVMASGAKYDAFWHEKMTATELYQVFQSDESSILFCARLGWIEATSPTCGKEKCRSKNTTSYVYKRKNGVWTWRFRCCKSTSSVFKNSMFYKSNYGPAKVLELMWYMASRIPVTTASHMIFARECSEVHTWWRFFREVAGYWEDKFIMKMGGPDAIVEGDGMFVIGKRKCGVGRWHSKLHVYAITERGSKKIRRIVVRDKSATVLSVFDKYLLPSTCMMTDEGTENTHFDLSSLVDSIFKITGPIHVDPQDPTKNTQTVESSHVGPKMRLRLSRGLPRHNIQVFMDFEDFVYNRTKQVPISIFKKLGDAAKMYCSDLDHDIPRTSLISQALLPDKMIRVPGLSAELVKLLAKGSVWNKAKKFQVKTSKVVSTRVELSRNTIHGEVRRGFIYDQEISWGSNETSEEFNLQTILVYCDCKYFTEETKVSGYCCSHIIGQLRRLIVHA